MISTNAAVLAGTIIAAMFFVFGGIAGFLLGLLMEIDESDKP